MKNSRVLIISNETLTKRMSGTAIRSLELAKLAANWGSVIISVPKIDPCYEMDFYLVEEGTEDFFNEIELADYIFIQGFGLERCPQLLSTNAIIIADMYCPVLLEYIQSFNLQNVKNRLEVTNSIINSQTYLLKFADYYICASERQRDFWIGWLAATNNIMPKKNINNETIKINDLIKILPFGSPERNPVEKFNGSLRKKFQLKDNDFIMIWGGGIYDWFDPQTIILAVQRLYEQNIKIHLIFLGVKHPNSEISQHQIVSDCINLAKKLNILNKLVYFNFDWVEYEKRDLYLRDANIAVSAHHESVETRYAFRTRILDYIWCEIPIISTKGDYFSSIIQDKGYGFTTNYNDVNDWVSKISILYNEQKIYNECVVNLKLTSSNFKWSKSSKVMFELLSSPKVDKKLSLNDKYFRSKKIINIFFLVKKSISFYNSYGMKKFVSKVFSSIVRKSHSN
ncbi:glycosyltransferase [Ferrovum sp. PN-J185]|uniref:glycosyltransferase n=1 Tax=Ferrovum sp. PN-J185 TaxID=1356306 RepID=UPI000799CDC0|nr:glycosyltransferase [Ferrovum sp. PN-J185]KXW55830.1 glycosyl transferases group 1 [Ferrovum sp. PN-J185]